MFTRPAPRAAGMSVAALLLFPILAFCQTFNERDALTGSAPVQVIHADFNNDSIPDLATANRDGRSVTIWLMNGDGTFRSRRDIVISQQYQVRGVVAGDFNHDRKIDLAVINGDPELSGQSLSILLGNGDGSFQPAQLNSAGQEPTSLGIGDFNGDGHDDLVAVCLLGSKGLDSVLFMFGDGKGGFPNILGIPNFGEGGRIKTVVVGDFNQDRKPDIAFLEDAGNISHLFALINLGGNSYVQKKISDVSAPSDISVADVNQDGFDDLLLTHNRCLVGTTDLECQDFVVSVTYFQGKGDGTFVARRIGTLPENEVLSNFFGPSAGDVNADGLKDVMVTIHRAGKSTSSVVVFLQRPDGTFANGKIYDTNMPAADPFFGSTLAEDLNRDGRLDIAVTGNQNQVAALINKTPIDGCPAPAQFRAVKLCLPLFSTVSSPVQVLANTRDNLPIEAMRVYVDGVSKFFTTDDLLSGRLNFPEGDHRMTVKAWDRLGSFSQTINFTVSTGCVLPGTDRTVKICSPANGSTSGSPVRLTATIADSGDVKAVQIYIDGSLEETTSFAQLVDRSLPMSTGTHRVTVKAWDAAGQFSQTVSVTVP